MDERGEDLTLEEEFREVVVPVARCVCCDAKIPVTQRHWAVWQAFIVNETCVCSVCATLLPAALLGGIMPDQPIQRLFDSWRRIVGESRHECVKKLRSAVKEKNHGDK